MAPRSERIEAAEPGWRSAIDFLGVFSGFGELGLDPGGPVFCTFTGNVRYMCRRLRTSWGCRSGRTPTLRHTHAHELFREHASLESTDKYLWKIGANEVVAVVRERGCSSRMMSTPKTTGRGNNDFPLKVKELLAERSAQRCSNPECRILTKGPRLSEKGRQNAGCAAHIRAAAPGGPRYDPSMTSEERSAEANGLWLCRNCGERVDDDEERYTVALLKKWKADIELEVERALGKPAPLGPLACPEVGWVVDGEDVEVLRLLFSSPLGAGAEAVNTKFREDELEELDEGSRQKAEAFNVAVDEYCDEVAAFEEKFALWKRAADDATAFSLKISNTGTEPLLSAHVHVYFPEGFVLQDDEHQVVAPKIPPMPERPPEIESLLYPLARSGLAFSAGLASFVPPVASWSPAVLDIRPPVKRWEWGVELGEGGKVQAWVEKLKHTFSHRFGDTVEVIPPRRAGTYSIWYEIIADNLPTPAKGELEVVVEAS